MNLMWYFYVYELEKAQILLETILDKNNHCLCCRGYIYTPKYRYYKRAQGLERIRVIPTPVTAGNCPLTDVHLECNGYYPGNGLCVYDVLDVL